MKILKKQSISMSAQTARTIVRTAEGRKKYDLSHIDMDLLDTAAPVIAVRNASEMYAQLKRN